MMPQPLDLTVDALRYVSRMMIEPPMGLNTRDVLARAMVKTGEPWVIITRPVLFNDWTIRLHEAGHKPHLFFFLTEARIVHARRPGRALDPALMSAHINVLADMCTCFGSQYRGVTWQAVNSFMLNRRRVWIRK